MSHIISAVGFFNIKKADHVSESYWAKINTGENSYFKGIGLDISCGAASAVYGQGRGGQVQGTAMGSCRRGHCHRVPQEGHP